MKKSGRHQALRYMPMPTHKDTKKGVSTHPHGHATAILCPAPAGRRAPLYATPDEGGVGYFLATNTLHLK